MKKILKFMVVLMLVITMSSQSVIAAAKVENTDKADALKAIGLFSGTSKGYELDRAPTRLEAAVMLVRLLGKETEAKTLNLQHPFTDVPVWANVYVGYMYVNGLSTGIGNQLFGSDKLVDGKSYMTFVLRALGYSDTMGDFTWATALEYATGEGIITEAERKNVMGQSFLRDELVFLSYKGLKAKLKDSQDILADKLITDKMIDSLAAVTNGFVDKNKYRTQLGPVSKLLGEFANMDTTQDVYTYSDKTSSIFNTAEGDGVYLRVPLIDGWDKNLVAKLDFYNNDKKLKTTYSLITDVRSKTSTDLSFFFLTPKDTFTSVKYSVFDANEFFMYDNFPKVTVHKIAWKDRNQTLTLFNKAKYASVDFLDSGDQSLIDEKLIFHAITNHITYYTDKGQYELSYYGDKDGQTKIRNTYKLSELKGLPYDITFVSTTTNLTNLQIADYGNGVEKYTVVANTNQTHTFVLRDANYNVTDIIQFTK